MSLVTRRSLITRFAASAPALALAVAAPVLVADAHAEAVKDAAYEAGYDDGAHDQRELYLALPPGPSSKALTVAYENGRADGYLRGHDVGSAGASSRAAQQIHQNDSEAYVEGYHAGRYDQAEIDGLVNTPTAVVVGAIYDFLDWLTTRETPITVSSAHEVYPLLDSFEAWAADRGVDIRHADVGGWEYRLS